MQDLKVTYTFDYPSTVDIDAEFDELEKQAQNCYQEYLGNDEEF